ncbi:hypothetical protein [Bacillus pinisoli]|uniref:hypothetical protein n=1 Tax=Bacillus pinisoli TaxID=2901866 RepID=UPI001FF3E2F8|nr:hypothetical protein [Bacillus pinisoli]
MRKSFFILLALSVLMMSGCQYDDSKYQATKQNIQYHYFEAIDSHAVFLQELQFVPSDQLLPFVQGYTMRNKHNDLYADVEVIAYEQLNQKLSPEMITTIQEVNNTLDRLISSLYSYLSQEGNDISKTTISDFTNLGVQIAHSDQSNLTLYNLLVYPEHIQKNYADSDISLFLLELKELLRKMHDNLII